jgi:hypothetical protein
MKVVSGVAHPPLRQGKLEIWRCMWENEICESAKRVPGTLESRLLPDQKMASGAHGAVVFAPNNRNAKWMDVPTATPHVALKI